MTTIKLIKGDKLYDINFILQDVNSEPINLTNATLKLKAQLSGADALKVNGTMNIVNATAGTCKYTVGATDFDTAGTYNAEVEVTYTSGEIITFSDITIKVRDDLPK